VNQQLGRETLARILEAEDVEGLSFPELVRLYEDEIADFVPDGECQVDPRNGDRILFASARSDRPHDNLPEPPGEPRPETPCVICQGDTTGVVDVADLSEGFTFINKNRYPILYPWGVGRSGPGGAGLASAIRGQIASGLHFVQWTSSLHDRDWHNMPLADCVIVTQRLAALERKLLAGSRELFPAARPWVDRSGYAYHGFVSVIKNAGRLVGGSLAHGHQQVALSNILPRRIRDDWRFERERGETFSAYLMRENPAGLLVRDYGPAVLLVPYFMRRPTDMMLVVKDTGKQHIHELSDAEIAAVAEGWRDAIRGIRLVMPRVGRELAYNVVAHNGPGAGLYFEFLPYVQEIGGAEHLGLFVCQGNPKGAAAWLRECLNQG
jgi:galactose-1-phosphate uridylyltransferase